MASREGTAQAWMAVGPCAVSLGKVGHPSPATAPGRCPPPRLLRARVVHDRRGGPAAGAPRFTVL